MFWLIRQVFILLSSLNGFLPTKWVLLNNEPFMNNPSTCICILPTKCVLLNNEPYMNNLSTCICECE